MTDALLQVEHLTVEFPHGRSGWVRVVDDVSFDVATGERLAIVGESGSGKSVTALSTMGLLDRGGRVAAGSIRLGGLDVLAASGKTMESVRGGRIAMVFQDALSSLDPVFTIGRQIDEVLRRHRPELGKSERTERATGLLAKVGIADPAARLSSYPHQLSGGMRQRALIAAALAGEPDLLIADEPTTALDVTVQAQVIELLADLTTERSMALILITHDLGVVANIADRVLVMYAGRIVEDAAADRLFDLPQHPYSAGLLDSIPRLDLDPTERLDAIPGSPPRPESRRAGCAFAPRCARAASICASAPTLAESAAGRVACHFPLVGS